MSKKSTLEQEWNEQRMDIIGQNGGDGAHYSELNNNNLFKDCVEFIKKIEEYVGK